MESFVVSGRSINFCTPAHRGGKYVMNKYVIVDSCFGISQNTYLKFSPYFLTYNIPKYVNVFVFLSCQW